MKNVKNCVLWRSSTDNENVSIIFSLFVEKDCSITIIKILKLFCFRQIMRNEKCSLLHLIMQGLNAEENQEDAEYSNSVFWRY